MESYISCKGSIFRSHLMQNDIAAFFWTLKTQTLFFQDAFAFTRQITGEKNSF